MKDFSDYFTDSVSERINDCLYEMSLRDESFRKAMEDYDRAVETLQKQLRPDSPNALLELEYCQNAVRAMENDFLYQQGMKDCILALKLLRIL
ncbi:MAG: hypothetical protein IJ043_10070 [Clostridia bacterium]|nr:hypothetical protein [Clostridia bacterium]